MCEIFCLGLANQSLRLCFWSGVSSPRAQGWWKRHDAWTLFHPHPQIHFLLHSVLSGANSSECITPLPCPLPPSWICSWEQQRKIRRCEENRVGITGSPARSLPCCGPNRGCVPREGHLPVGAPHTLPAPALARLWSHLSLPRPTGPGW